MVNEPALSRACQQTFGVYSLRVIIIHIYGILSSLSLPWCVSWADIKRNEGNDMRPGDREF